MKRSKQTTKELLIGHYEQFPELQIQDIFKYIYQSAFGCEHMVTSLEKAADGIGKEYEDNSPLKNESIVLLDGDFCRVPLSVLDRGVTKEKLAHYFFLSSLKKADGMEKLTEMTKEARDLIAKKALPFSLYDYDKALNEWKTNGYEPVHHSKTFNSLYKPSYRVIAKEYVGELADCY